MKKILYGIMIGWVGFACTQGKSQEGGGNSKPGSAPGVIFGAITVKEKEKTLPDSGTTVYAVSTKQVNSSASTDDLFKNVFFEAIADANGNYMFTSLPPDTYTIVFKSANAPKKLIYYKPRYTPILSPIVNDKSADNRAGKDAKQTRLDDLFGTQQVHVKPDIKLEPGGKQVVAQEFIK
ncbi:hypothetical protein [Adhaeribacter aquaticus]|uniref:hypothetical protein n=1 Tax=Adhaeribacter aquaticus TaxID=299567 RepID=UPI00047A1D95|nr:hypothetical protein [Adhaeribacter aquaticus]